MNYSEAFMIPIITAVTEVFKRMGLPNNLTTFLSLILGVLAGFIYVSPKDWREALLRGIIMGLSASGLYDFGKHIMEHANSLIKNLKNKKAL